MNFTMNTAAVMAAESFRSSALVIPVRPAPPGSPYRLEVPAGNMDKLAELRAASEASMAAVGAPERAPELVAGLMATELGRDEDVWFSRLDHGTMVILVRDDVYRQLGEREVAEHVHMAVVEEAVRKGEPVPDDLVKYYRGKSQPSLSPVMS